MSFDKFEKYMRTAQKDVINMKTLLFTLINSFMVGVFFCGLYLTGRVLIPILAEKDTFFSSPKLGRIKARKRGGRIVGFFDNLVGKNRHVNCRTGKVEEGEINYSGFWWKFFGAYFIGLDEVYKYTIAYEVIADEQEVKYLEVEASSIFIEGSYSVTAIFVTKDGVSLRVSLQLKLTTIDASKALSLQISWTIPVFKAVLAASRDYFGARNLKDLICAQNEGTQTANEIEQINSSDFIQHILNLNVPKIGNISLKDICGQNIDAVNLTDIELVDRKVREAFSAPFIASQEAQKQVKEAEAYANAVVIKSEGDKLAAVNLALVTTLLGNAEAGVYGKKREGLGGDSKATAQVLIAEKQSTMKGLTTLVNGGNSVLSIPTGGKENG